MKQELTVRFSEIVDQQHVLTLLRKIKQKRRESIQLFAERLLTLSEDTFDRDGAGVLGQGAEQQLVAYFIDGLWDYHLKAKILRENPAKFRAAVTCAANEQNVQDRIQLRLGKPAREKERVDIFQGYREEPVRREEPMEVGHIRPLHCFKCGGPHKAKDCREPGAMPAGDVPRERKNRSVQCWECGGPHFKKDCKNGKPKNGQHLPPLKEASSERKQRTSAMPEKNFSINLAGSPNSCVIQLGKQWYRALVDTGAKVSLVHRRVFDKLKHRYVLGKQKVNLQAVNGNKLQVDGCATIKFKLGGRKFQHMFYVVDGLNRNVILGRDWIINNKVVLYFNELCSMKIGHVYVPLEEDIHISALV